MNSMGHRFVLVLAVVILLVGASSASADSIVNYQISGPGFTGTFTLSFSLHQNPKPSAGNQRGFDFANLPVDVDGTWKNLTVYFYNGLLIGRGPGASNSFSLFGFGQQLYSWSASDSTPTLELGTFYARGALAGSRGLYTVTVTDPPGAAPEPASVTLLGMGLLTLCGVRLRRRSV